MKMKKYFNLLLVLCAVCLCTISCKNNTQKVEEEDDGITEFARGLTTQDTLNVQNLLTKFLDAAVAGQFEDAAAMLYTPDTANVWYEPLPLDNDQLHAEAYRLSLLPPKRYTIDYINFSSAVENDAKVTLIVEEGDKEKGIEPVTVNIHLNPMNYLGGWRLCIASKD
jgi:hypothetical protein